MEAIKTMTELEIKQKLNDCDKRIIQSYKNLLSEASNVGENAYQAVNKFNPELVFYPNKWRLIVPIALVILGAIVFLVSCSAGLSDSKHSGTSFSIAWYAGAPMVIVGVIMGAVNRKKENEEKEATQRSVKTCCALLKTNRNYLMIQSKEIRKYEIIILC